MILFNQTKNLNDKLMLWIFVLPVPWGQKGSTRASPMRSVRRWELLSGLLSEGIRNFVGKMLTCFLWCLITVINMNEKYAIRSVN